MSLTEDDVQILINAHPTLWERMVDGKQDEFGEWETDTTLLDRFAARAKRLLPLWRQWGLMELAGNKATIGESSLGRLEYKGPWSAWLSWFARAPLAFPADYDIVFRVTQPRKKRGS